MPAVELVYDPACPNVAAARARLLRAFARTKLEPRWSEWSGDDPDCPERLRGYGSPTILVDGQDVAAGERSGGPCCRLYAQPDGAIQGVPSLEMIATALLASGHGTGHTPAANGTRFWNTWLRRRMATRPSCAAGNPTYEEKTLGNHTTQDLVERRARWVVWGIPFAFVIAGAFMEAQIRAWFWTPAFAVGGIACVLNALACSRTHCVITGPLFLLASAASFLQGAGIIVIGWTAIGVGVIIGLAVAYEVEWVRGRYVRTHS